MLTARLAETAGTWHLVVYCLKNAGYLSGMRRLDVRNLSSKARAVKPSDGGSVGVADEGTCRRQSSEAWSLGNEPLLPVYKRIICLCSGLN